MTAVTVPGLAGLAARHPFLISDLWGVIHDGREAFPAALDALARYRAGGGRTIILSNSPQRSDILRPMLARKGIDARVHDRLITSGDLVREAAAERFAGARFFHVGPAGDRPTVEGLPLDEAASPGGADLLIATGLLAPTAEAHRELLAPAAARGIPLLCANPDRVVVHAGRREVCAGALADLYAAAGGPVVWLGKPAAAAYAACRRAFAEIAGAPVPDSRVLAVGDAFATDLAGAVREGFASLLIESGIHADEIAQEGIAALAARHGVMPAMRMPVLRW